MPKYSSEQIALLSSLRILLGEKGLKIFDLRRAKHPLEFLAVDVKQPPASAALVRTFYGKIRIQFVYCNSIWPAQSKDTIIQWAGDIVFFGKESVYIENLRRYDTYRKWISYIKKKQLQELNLLL